MSALVLATQRTAQPQGPIAVDYGNPLARGLVFAINPSAGGFNLARSNWPSVNTELVRSTSASVLFSSGAANYSQSINNANGLTLFSILRSRDASQYLFGDGERSILSARNASNQGWTWSRTGAADIGGSRGNATRQAFTLNGIAAYSEANATIESFADVPVALRYVKSSGVISWFSNGRKSSNDTNGSTGGTVGGDLVFRRQGPYANNLQPYIDKTGLTLVFERALSDAEIAAISANPWQLFKPIERRIWVPVSAGGGGASQTVAFTLDGISAAVAQVAGRSQSLSASLDGVTFSASQVAGHSQTLAATLDGVSFSAAQSVGGANSQSLAVTLDGVQFAASQTLGHAQALAATLDDLTFSAAQSAASPVKSQSLAFALDDLQFYATQEGPAVEQAHGFVLVDFEPRLWWKRKPKALDEQEAAEKIASVARQIERLAVKQVKAGLVVQPVVSKPAKAEILQAIAPELQQMPGFDPVELYRAILERLIQLDQQRQAEQQAQQIAAQEIERIRLMELDEDETIILLMGA